MNDPSTITLQTCITCNVEMLLRQMHVDNLRASRELFYCVNGHAQKYGPSKAERERDEYRARAERAEREAASARESAALSAREAKLNANRCSHCAKKYDSPEKLSRHVRRVHEAGPKRLPATAGPSH